MPDHAVAEATRGIGDQALDGTRAWFHFDGSTLKHHPADTPNEVQWTCRYNLAPTPMTIDIFKKDGPAHGIFVSMPPVTAPSTGTPQCDRGNLLALLAHKVRPGLDFVHKKPHDEVWAAVSEGS